MRHLPFILLAMSIMPLSVNAGTTLYACTINGQTTLEDRHDEKCDTLKTYKYDFPAPVLTAPPPIENNVSNNQEPESQGPALNLQANSGANDSSPYYPSYNDTNDGGYGWGNYLNRRHPRYNFHYYSNGRNHFHRHFNHRHTQRHHQNHSQHHFHHA